MKKKFFIKNSKRKSNQKHNLINDIIFLFVIQIFLVTITPKSSIRELNSYYSEIDLVFQGSGVKTLFNNTFIKESFEVLVNGDKNNSCLTTCNLEGTRNKITLVFLEQVKSCHSMFADLTDLIKVDLSRFDASQVTTMYWMFLRCTNLEKITFGNINTSSVTNMRSIFNGCSKLSTIDLSNFGTSNVETIHSMFNGCTNLKFLDLSYFNTSKFQQIDYLFFNCQSLIFFKLFKLEGVVSKER